MRNGIHRAEQNVPREYRLRVVKRTSARREARTLTSQQREF